MNLLIVESPAKGGTIEKYLGGNYKVMASYGHVRDLPKKELGVDVENDFIPKYTVPAKAKKTISALKEAIAQADKVYLATDYDREGEAIAWHVLKATGLEKYNKQKEIKRITFTEITKNALLDALKNPREIDINLVDAQQARRVLDRLVGYKLSPFLWKKVFKGLSAGRVQSVAVRLIVEKEQEIDKFKPIEYWTVGAKLAKDKEQFVAYLTHIDGKKISKYAIANKIEANKITDNLKNAQYKVKDITAKEVFKHPYAPFTTSTLQQEASHKLYFSAKQTMKLAQDLYEAGHITYMRTDSVTLSSQALKEIRDEIKNNFSAMYLPENQRIYKTKSKGAQEAHEAIRPTNIRAKREDLSGKKFDEKHLKLYDLIYRRTLASQMNSAVIDTLSVAIEANNYIFTANGSTIKFDGYMAVWPVAKEDRILPELKINDLLDFMELISEEHFTKPPARYTEATLVKALEEYGIGRPSTYAPIISTIQERGYVKKEQGKLFPTETAKIVTKILIENFPEIIDIKFTAGMENKLDNIAENKLTYLKMLKDFYLPFEKNLNEKTKSVEKINLEEKLDEKCPNCGKYLVVKMGRFGKFIACSGFPECKYIKKQVIKTGLICPECKTGDVIEKKTRRGKIFWGCSRYPDCKWATWNDPTKEKIENQKSK